MIAILIGAGLIAVLAVWGLVISTGVDLQPGPVIAVVIITLVSVYLMSGFKNVCS